MKPASTAEIQLRLLCLLPHIWITFYPISGLLLATLGIQDHGLEVDVQKNFSECKISSCLRQNLLVEEQKQARKNSVVSSLLVFFLPLLPPLSLPSPRPKQTSIHPVRFTQRTSRMATKENTGEKNSKQENR